MSNHVDQLTCIVYAVAYVCRIAPPSIAESSALSKRSARRGDTAARDMINTDEALAAAEDDDGAGDRRDRRGDDRRRDDRRSDDRRASESRAAPAMWSYPQEDAYGRNGRLLVHRSGHLRAHKTTTFVQFLPVNECVGMMSQPAEHTTAAEVDAGLRYVLYLSNSS